MEPPPVQYVTTSDGYNIAYTVCGQGRPFVMIPRRYSHAEIYWQEETFFRPWLLALSASFRLILFDGRGQGLSTRGLPPSTTVLNLLEDLAAVVDKLGLTDYVLAANGIAWRLAAHETLHRPDRVAGLVLWDPQLARPNELTPETSSAIRHGWESYLLSVGALNRSPSSNQATVSRLSQTTSMDDWFVRLRALADSGADADLLRLNAPALVIRTRGLINPSEDAMRLASANVNAQLVTIDGDTAYGNVDEGIHKIQAFIAGLPRIEPPTQAGPLSSRELEVLRLIAAGKTNQQIADELVISINTVRRHVSNILAKTGAANRTEAALHARDRGLA